MKINKHLIMVGVALIANSFTVEAQFLDKLQKRAEKRAQERIENKIEKQVDKAVDNTVDAPEKAVKENKKSKKKSESQANKSSNINLDALMGAQNVKISDSYDFNQKVVYEMTGSYDDKPYEMTYWFGNNEQIFAAEITMQSDMLIIYDLTQDAILMFSEKDKYVQAVPIGLMSAFNENSEEITSEYTFKKVDGKKKINGYDCQKYLMTSSDMEGEFWFTNDVDITPLDLSKTFMTANKANQNVPKMDTNNYGFLMEMRATDKSTKAVTTMKVKELSKSNKKVTTANYKKQ